MQAEPGTSPGVGIATGTRRKGPGTATSAADKTSF